MITKIIDQKAYDKVIAFAETNKKAKAALDKYLNILIHCEANIGVDLSLRYLGPEEFRHPNCFEDVIHMSFGEIGKYDGPDYLGYHFCHYVYHKDGKIQSNRSDCRWGANAKNISGNTIDERFNPLRYRAERRARIAEANIRFSQSA